MSQRWQGWRRELKREVTLFILGLAFAAVAGVVIYYGLLAGATPPSTASNDWPGAEADRGVLQALRVSDPAVILGR